MRELKNLMLGNMVPQVLRAYKMIRSGKSALKEHSLEIAMWSLKYVAVII